MENLIDLDNTGNVYAKAAIEKLNYLIAKNSGLSKVAGLAKGQGIQSPGDCGYFVYAPATSTEVERLFSILKDFGEDRPHITEENVKKLIMIKYKQDL